MMKLFVEYMEKEKVTVINDEMVNRLEVAIKQNFNRKKNLRILLFAHKSIVILVMSSIDEE